LTHTGRLVPIYPETEKLSSRWLRFILKPLLLEFKNKITETLPEKILKENNFLGISEALWQIHFPASKILAERAQQRFSFEELFFIELFVLRQRAKLSKEKAISFTPNLEKIKKFVSGLNFKLTDSQRKSAWQILKDLERPRPMNRLLEGDVGSGKTVVAAIAALNVAKPLASSFDNRGLQTAFMAPTEILSKQHFQEIARLFGDFSLNIGLLTGKQDQFYSKKLKNQVIEISRKKLLEKILSGDIDILIGTHALIQDKVKFGRLGLVILDEQHRFGVEQRAKLCKTKKETKNRSRPELDQNTADVGIPHLLSMTATPIPRTLALTIYGDLDLSLMIPSISVDYAVMERTEKIRMVPSDFEWSDMGSFESIYDYLDAHGYPKDSNGNMVIGTDVHTEFLGIENTILIQTEDAILVLRKENAQDVKQIFERLEGEGSGLVD
jgi:ATP-dependent DNA helicase RecG